MKTNILITFSILLAFLATLCCGIQPLYQVSLYVHLHPRGPPVHVCSGAIVQSRYILTAATCVHYKFSPSSPAIALLPTMMSVVSGSSTPFADELTVQVQDILVAKHFNYTTGENDLALLRLHSKLPLDARNDMKWIILDNAEKYDGPCLSNFYVRNSQDGASNYVQSEEFPLLDSEICSNRYEYTIEREDDICSLYYLPTDFNCDAFETLQHYNEDRGMGLVCENNLVGILSNILPLQNNTDCMENPIKAYYTSLAPHLEWIYNIITEDDLKMINQGNYVFSSPYAGETYAFVQPEIADSTLDYFVGSTTNTTESSSVQRNSAHRMFNFLPGIFGIYLLLPAFSSN